MYKYNIYFLIVGESDNTILSFSNQSNNYNINLSSVINFSHPIIFPIQDKNQVIKCSFIHNSSLIGNCEFFPFTDTKWISIKPNSPDTPLIKLKIKSSYNLNTAARKKNQPNSNMKENFTRGNSKKTATTKIIQPGNITHRINNSAIKEQTFLRKFLFDKKSTSKNKMIPQENRLKHNKSCEEGIWGTTHSIHSPRIYSEFSNRNEDSHNGTNKIKTVKKNNNDKNNNNVFNNSSSKNTMTEIKLKSNNKSNHLLTPHNHELSTSVSLVNKLDEKFRTIEESIIDKTFEKNIDNDEMIISQKTFFELTSKDEIHSHNINRSLSFEIKSDDNNEEMNDLLDKFHNVKNDFEILYTNKYSQTVREDLLKLEVQLVIEKLFKIQSEYHSALNKLRQEYHTLKNDFKQSAFKYFKINKQYLNLQQQKEKIQFINSLNMFVNNHKIKNDKEIMQIHFKECALWKKITFHDNHVKTTKKNMLLKIFEKNTLHNKKNLSLLSELEKIISEKLIKKYNIKKKLQTQGNSSQKQIHNEDKLNQKQTTISNNHTKSSSVGPNRIKYKK